MTEQSTTGLLGVSDGDHSELPLTDDLTWLRQRLARFVEGGVYLLAGQPGIGKSTLAIQLAIDLGKQSIKSLYVLTEQSKSDLAKRAKLLVSQLPPSQQDAVLSCIEPYDDLSEVSQLPGFLTRHVLGASGRYKDCRIIILDSIQGHGLAAAATKQYRQVYEFCRTCKVNGITTVLIAHVTKKGEIAGPKDLEHNVDCVLYMRKAMVYRPLFVPKNRFGPALLKPVPLEISKKTTALELSPHSQSVSTVARTFFGRSAGQAEAQAAVALPSYGTRGQITAPGLPKKEIEQLLNCIDQLPEMDIGDMSYTIQCRLPGERRYRRLLDLPLAMALIASYLQREIPAHHLYIGELDLLRRVREIPDTLVQEMWDAIEAGEIARPVRVFCPSESAALIREIDGITVFDCATLDDAVYATWQDLKGRV